MNLFAGRFSRDGSGLLFHSQALGEVALPASLTAPDPHGELAFRPHAVRLCAGDTPAAHEQMRMAGVVQSQEFLGEFLRYQVRVGSGLVLVDQSHARGEQPLPVGAPVTLLVPAPEIRFIAA